MPTLRLLTALVALLGTVRLAPGQDTLHERWYVLEMMGTRAGWTHARVHRDGDLISTDMAMHMELNRAGAGITIRIDSTFVETRGGEPVSASTTMAMGGAGATTTRYTFTPEGIVQETDSAGQTTKTTLPPIEGVWLTPAESRTYLTERLKAEPESITLRTVDPTMSIQPVTITYTGFTQTTLELLGRTVKAWKCTSTNSAAPTITSTEYLDDRGEALRTEMNMGGMTIVMIAADRELAVSEVQAPEMMASLFIRPSKPIAGARTLEKATYLLHVPEGELAAPPETGSQRVERVDEQSVRVTINAGTFAPAGEVDAAPYLERSTMLDTGDEKIRELCRQALEGAEEGKAERAEMLRRFVHRHIDKKNLGVGFASASEVARSCEGDCSEHGTLLAALLRVDGIPARVVSGVVYVDEFAGSNAIFGYHMWTQALLTIDGQRRWVDLDATLPGALTYDATHIALGLSSLNDGQVVNGLVSLAPLMGRLQIDVESLD
ncbi:MAG: transglutaminase domain-containing protein [Leptolyngbya sp. PLA3]|nr:MAG: transglutaminase domain-containing protein [Cyanobacteria bacterium CYA]MCE7969868.1 transglutaminase domain-containing protein [Leptolyngbya sp. PL-A3]